MSDRTVAIVGGGLAGLAAAVRLIRQGVRPVLLEKRPFLGGRAFSFTDPETGVEVDNGQHIFVGACTEYQAYLKEIGAWSSVRLEPRLDSPVLSRGKIVNLRSSKLLPGPLANLPAILGYRHISVAARLRVLYGLLRIKGAKLPGGGGLQDETFEAWLRRHGQNDETIRRFWNLIVLPALNDDIGTVGAEAGLMLFQVALLGPPSNAAMGLPLVGLSTLAGESGARYVTGNGGEVRSGVEVTGLAFEDGRVTGVGTATDGFLPADATIVATPARAMLDLLPHDLAGGGFFSPASGIETAPIVGVHIWYDRPVLEHDFIAVLDSELQWVFNVTSLHGEENGAGQHIVISLSGAWKWRDLSKAELREIFASEMARAFPTASMASIERFLIVKMLDATFRVTPGAERCRLPQKTPVPGLFLAGDWTQTGWPSTMESAVRSGNLAADAVLEQLAGE